MSNVPSTYYHDQFATAHETTLIEWLRRIPADARLESTDTDGLEARHFVAIGGIAAQAARALTALNQQVEALPDVIDLFHIIRAAGRSDIAKARAVARCLGTEFIEPLYPEPGDDK